MESRTVRLLVFGPCTGPKTYADIQDARIGPEGTVAMIYTEHEYRRQHGNSPLPDGDEILWVILPKQAIEDSDVSDVVDRLRATTGIDYVMGD